MQILTNVSWNVVFPNDEAEAEFNSYIAKWQNEFSKFDPFEEVKVTTPTGRVLYMQGWEFREYLLEDLTAMVEELGGNGADIDTSYTDKPMPITKAPQAPAPVVISPDTKQIQAGIEESERKKREAAQEASKKIVGALRDVTE